MTIKKQQFGEILLCGDVHQKLRLFHEIVREKDRNKFIVQLGDFCMCDPRDTLKNVDSDKVRIIRGNHCRHDLIHLTPHYYQDYFSYEELNGVKFFQIGGAYSIDRMYRTPNLDWFETEEMTIDKWEECFKLYKQIKPDIVLTHDCPRFLTPQLIPPNAPLFNNRTGWGLEEVWNIHAPKAWFFCHYHISKEIYYNNTFFKCLNELEIYRLKYNHDSKEIII
jgi:hypothetical protein